MITHGDDSKLDPIRVDIAAMVLALWWRRLVRVRKVLRKPWMIALSLVAGAAIVGVLSRVLGSQGPESASRAGAGVLAGLVVIPVLSARRTFDVRATAADAQWVLTAPAGARCVLIEDASFRLVRTLLFLLGALLSGAVAGRGRPAGAPVVMLTATILFLATSSLGPVTYKIVARFRRFRLGQAAVLLVGLMLVAGTHLRILGLGLVADAAGSLVLGHLHVSGLVFLASVAAVSLLAWRDVLESSTFFVEPMIQAGMRDETRSLANQRANPGYRASSSWDGGRRLVGPSALAYLQLAQLRRNRRPALARILIVGSLAALLAGPLHASTWVCFFPTLGLATAALLSRPEPQVARDEWLTRAPCSKGLAIVVAQTRELLEGVVWVLITSVPVSLRTDYNASSDLAIAGSCVLLTLTLVASRSYATLSQAERPTRGAVVRGGAPVVLAALVVVLWNASGRSTWTTALGVAIACIPGLFVILMLHSKVAPIPWRRPRR